MIRSPYALLLVVSWLLGTAACASTPLARPEAFPRTGAPAVLPTASGPAVSRLMETALEQRGVRYQLGGATPASGFDCSGLVQFVFHQHGIVLPRTAAEQFRAGVEISQEQMTSGDLVFFATSGTGPTHVGIVVEPGTFIHAPDSGAVVRVERFDTPYWTSRFLGVRRVAG